MSLASVLKNTRIFDILGTVYEELVVHCPKKIYFGLILCYDGTLTHTVVYRKWKWAAERALKKLYRTDEFHRGIYHETQTDMYSRLKAPVVPTPDPNRLAALVHKYFRPDSRNWTRPGVPAHWN